MYHPDVIYQPSVRSDQHLYFLLYPTRHLYKAQSGFRCVPNVSSAAIEALARCSHAKAVRALIHLAVDRRLREPVVSALAGMPEKRIGWVASGLEHPHPEVRMAVIDALGRMKRADATEMILGCLNDPDWRVRMAAIAVFIQTGNRAAEKKLAQMSEGDPHPDVRHAARKALTRVIGE